MLAAEIKPQLIVILSDINMPGMDGLTLLREVKNRHPDLPVMMVTAYGDDKGVGWQTNTARCSSSPSPSISSS